MGQSNSQAEAEFSREASDEPPGTDNLATATKTGVLKQVMAPATPQPYDQQAQQVMVNILTQEVQGMDIQDDTVLLHVYDLMEGALKDANQFFSFAVDEISLGGAFHAGVEVYGTEWSYGSWAGVYNAPPRSQQGHVYRCSVYLGRTPFDKKRVAEILHEMCQTWMASDYDLLAKNCCSFSGALCEKLRVGPMPAWVDRFARIGKAGRTAGREALDAGRKVGGEISKWMSEAQPMIKGFLDEVAAEARRRDGIPDAFKQGPQGYRSGHGQAMPFPARSGAPPLGPYPGAPGAGAPGAPTAPLVMVSSVQVERKQTPDLYPAFAAAGGPAFASASNAQSAGIPAGTVVEYESASQACWIPARVLSFHDGLYDLDCKPRVPPQKVRLPAGGGQTPGGSQTPSGRSQIMELPAGGSQTPSGRSQIMEMPATSPLDATCAFPGAATTPRSWQGGFAVGSIVEYESASQNRWIPATVRAVHPEGLYDLDCKPQVPPQKIRWPEGRTPVAATPPTSDALTPQAADRRSSGRTPSAAEARLAMVPEEPTADAQRSTIFDRPAEDPDALYKLGANLIGREVEYETEVLLPNDAKAWMPATVVAYHPASGHFDLSCMDDVPAERLRFPPANEGPPNADGSLSARGRAESSSPAKPSGEQPFAVGDDVEYESTSQGDRWLPAKVLAFHAESCMYDLDIKPQVHRAKIRSGEPFPTGADVEYGSSSAGQGPGFLWIPATVLSLDVQAGLYELSCKQQAERGRIRWPRQDS